MNEVHYTVMNMEDDDAVQRITQEVTNVTGVASVDVQLSTRTLTVTGDEVDSVAVRSAIEEAGFDVAVNTAVEPDGSPLT